MGQNLESIGLTGRYNLTTLTPFPSPALMRPGRTGGEGSCYRWWTPDEANCWDDECTSIPLKKMIMKYEKKTEEVSIYDCPRHQAPATPGWKGAEAARHPCTLRPAAGGWGTHGEPLCWLVRLAKLCKRWVSSGKNIHNSSQLDARVTLTDRPAHPGDQSMWHKIWLVDSPFPNTPGMYSTQLLWYEGSWEEESVARRKTCTKQAV